jgi:hypothetical protein
MIFANFSDRDIDDLIRLFGNAGRPLPTVAEAFEIIAAEQIIVTGLKQLWEANHVGFSGVDRPHLRRNQRWPCLVAPVAGVESGSAAARDVVDGPVSEG